MDVPRPSLAGRTLGRYRLEEQIGAGGMGEVYRAHDDRLNRVVAIKVIAPHLLDKEQARERFEREARAIAAFSHPNICTVYDVGSADGVEFLVMEHLEGETLASRLARQRGGALPLHETLPIATQLADALAAAHRAGVVHRDLKPANVMLTGTGVARHGVPQAKVLDFGLAKQPAVATGDRTTTTLSVTGAETIVGTLPYMAPEQLQGHKIDARTDLFAFGALVYEMASGRRAFSGDSQASLIAAILDRDPEPLSGSRPMVPPGLDRLVRKCLAKDPAARWQSASDVADELRWIAAGSGSGSTALPGRAHRHLFWRVAIIAAGLILAAAAGVGIWKWRSVARPETAHAQHRQVTFAGDVVGAAISPDGRSVVYGMGEQGTEVRVLVRDLAGGQTQPIWTGKLLWAVNWMPEGAEVLVSGDDGTWILPRLGGSARRVFDGSGWVVSSPDGKAVAFTSTAAQSLDIVSREGGSTRQVKMTGFRWVMALDWHPRANRIVLLTSSDDQAQTVWSVAPDGQEQKRLYSSKDGIGPICSSPVSDVVYALRDRGSTSDLTRISMGSGGDSADLLMTGLPLTGVIDPGSGRCSVSADGRRLVYTPVASHANLWRLDLARPTETTSLTRGTLQFMSPKVSPDGLWIAATRSTESGPELVRIPIRGGEPVGLGEGYGAVWSPDGTRLAFVSSRGGFERVWVMRADGVSPEEVKDSPVGNPLLTWLPDGRLAWQTPGNQNYRIRDLRTGQDEYLLKDDSFGWVFLPQFSPRGDQVAVLWNRRMKRPSDPGLWLLSWPGREERRLTPQELRPIGWSTDGQWIYASPYQGRAVVRVSARTGKTERVGEFPVGTLQDNFCDLTHDRSAIICSLTEQKSDAWLIEDFDPEVRTNGGGRVR